MNLCKTPNQHANKPSIKIINQNVKVNGYNSYEIKNRTLYNKSQNLKFELVKPYLSNLENKKVVDLGCANGLYTIHSAMSGAEKVYAVDVDNTHLNIVQQISNKYDLNVEPVLQNAEDFNTKVDITISLALIHWVYSCTSVKFGSIDKIINWLSSITNQYLIIEWIDAKNDTNVNFFKHTEYNPASIKEEYSKQTFDNALLKYFKEVKFIGDVNKFRKLYVAYK